MQTASITYNCLGYRSAKGRRLQLVEKRRGEELSAWSVIWPDKKPIQTVSFEYRTGSVGGSQGIKWREANGRYMIGYMSFSDLGGAYGSPVGMWITIAEGSAPVREWTQIDGSLNFDCAPDRRSYAE